MIVEQFIDQNDSGIEIVDKNADVNTMWGITANTVTTDQLEELKNGKCIYFDDGEYAHIIHLVDKS